MLSTSCLHLAWALASTAPQAADLDAYTERFHAGHVALAAGELDAAATVFASALESAPETANCAYALACVAARAGDADEAEAWLARAIEWGFDDLALARWDPDLEQLDNLERVLFAITSKGLPAVPTRELLLDPALRPLALHGDWLVTGGARVYVWDTRSGELRYVLDAARRRIAGAAFLPDGETLIVAGLDGELTSWNVTTGVKHDTLERLPTPVVGFRVTKNGEHLVARVGAPRSRHVRALVSEPSGDATHEGSSSDAGYTWRIDGFGAVHVLAADGSEVVDLSVAKIPFEGVHIDSARRRVLAWGPQGIRAFELDSGARADVDAELADATRFAASTDGSLLFAWSQESARLVRPTGGEVVWSAEPQGPRVLGVAFASSGDAVAIERYGRGVSLLDTRTGAEKLQLGTDVLAPFWPRFLPDDRTVVDAHRDGTVRLFDVANGSETARLEGHTARVVDLDWSADGRLLASASEDGTARVWDLGTSEELHALRAWSAERRWSSRLALDTGAKRVMTSSIFDPTRIWSVATGERLVEIETPSPVGAWSPGGDVIALAHAQRVQRYDAASGERRGSALEHPTHVAAIAFDPQGRQLATGAEDELLRLWNATTGELTHEARHTGSFVFGVRVPFLRYTADGAHLLSSTSAAGTVQCWDPSTAASEWVIDYRGGNAGSIVTYFDASGERAYVSGMIAANTRVVSLASGKTLFNLAREDVYGLNAGQDGRYAVAENATSTVVFDGRDLRRLYARSELAGAGALTHTPELFVWGSPAALRAAWIVEDGVARRLTQLAPELYDPKRIRAAAAGIRLQR
ncbi:MAG: PQQ-binding-like beta-propeller repeat protein [bacterium]|nr:PQQ-binding-like beta-propeller repeat protein [bacterium]